MKRIQAVIQPHKLDEVKEALSAVGVEGVTLSDVRGHGRQKGHTEVYRGQEYTIDFLPKVEFDMVVADANVEQVIQVITKAAQSGKIGDGKIFVSPVEDAVRIRNGDRGEAAL
jgi:nitrogen regulatory protein P-II 1